MTYDLIRRGDQDTDTQRDSHMKTPGEDGTYEQRREASSCPHLDFGLWPQL
jgi:hypothetical protein